MKIEITDNLSARLDRLGVAVGPVVELEAAEVVADAQAMWPVSGDATPSADLLGYRVVGETVLEVFNEADYATEIRGGETVSLLLDEPLAEAATRLGVELPRAIGEALWRTI